MIILGVLKKSASYRSSSLSSFQKESSIFIFWAGERYTNQKMILSFSPIGMDKKHIPQVEVTSPQVCQVFKTSLQYLSFGLERYIPTKKMVLSFSPIGMDKKHTPQVEVTFLQMCRVFK